MHKYNTYMWSMLPGDTHRAHSQHKEFNITRLEALCATAIFIFQSSTPKTHIAELIKDSFGGEKQGRTGNRSEGSNYNTPTSGKRKAAMQDPTGWQPHRPIITITSWRLAADDPALARMMCVD